LPERVLRICSDPLGTTASACCCTKSSRRANGEAEKWPAAWLPPPKAAGEVAYESYTMKTVDESDDINVQFNRKCSVPTDIYEHLPTLYKYSLGCTDIAEFGVRSVVSTWAFLKGLKDTDSPTGKKKLICCDLEKSPNISLAEIAAKNNSITLEFIEGNDLSVNLKDGVDLLFIDTWHVYPQLKLELDIHSRNVRKYIALHDTTIDGEKGESVRMNHDIAALARDSGFSEEDIKTGLGKAVKEFIETHPDWKIKEVFTNNNGLTVLERVAPHSSDLHMNVD